MRAFARYLSLDRKGLIQINKEIETLNYDVKKTNSIYIGRHYGIKILFEYALTNKVKDNTIEIVFDIGKKATLSTDHLLHFPCYHFHILEAFVMCGMPREAMRCVEYIKANYHEISHLSIPSLATVALKHSS